MTSILKLISEGASFHEILALYPDLETEDRKQAVAFAARAVDQREIALAS